MLDPRAATLHYTRQVRIQLYCTLHSTRWEIMVVYLARPVHLGPRGLLQLYLVYF